MSTTLLQEARQTIVPPKDNPHGPLPALLVLLTIVTGLVDAFSYLTLDRVFVANMTGNVVFLSFSLGGAAGFKWWASLEAIFTFSGGALLGGSVVKRYGRHRGRHLYVAAATQLVFVTAAVVLAFISAAPITTGPLIALVLVLGIAMGLQNATARSLSVPDLTTTVLTLTITGISADSEPAGGKGSHLGRRAVSIAAMFAGGLAGALLVVNGDGPWALLAAAALLGVIVLATSRVKSSTGDWAAPKK